MIRMIVLVLFVGTAVPIFGCRSKSGSSSAQGDQTGRIELWDGQVKMRGLDSFHVEVKYRFVEGRPNPDVRYRFELDMILSYTLADVMGKDLQPEGAFQADSPMIRNAQSFTMRVEAMHHTVSNELHGTVQPMLLKQ